MAAGNPFDELSVFLPPLVVQVFIVLMIIAVDVGTLVDRLHQGRNLKFNCRH